ncbi:zinc-dependent alcohol dehydrogenase [Kocuria aegyptia]|uniref:Galactitol-1-phosphate 5-dehydrogenase n=1 Tax=Kocuria aegyptia TaxID=330943 RepID=A0ABP4X2F5_9MICC
MKALVLEQFNQFGVHDIDVPRPGPNDVLLRITATGICGSDIHGFTGENGRRVPGQIMGHESAGHIAQVGEGVSEVDFPIGRPATFNPVIVPDDAVESFAGREQHCPEKVVVGVAQHYQASFADYVVVPARNVVLLSDQLPVHLGALIEPIAVAVHAARRAHVRAGQKVLVIGGGPIGQSTILALQMEGVTDIALSEMSAERRALCKELGAQPIDPTAGPLADQIDTVFGSKADVTIDAVGITPTVNDALHATVLGGTVALVGMGSPRVDLEAFAVSTEERTLVGSFTYSARDFADAANWAGDHAALLETLVSRVVTPEEAHDAFTAAASGGETAGKVLVAFDDITTAREH